MHVSKPADRNESHFNIETTNQNVQIQISLVKLNELFILIALDFK